MPAPRILLVDDERAIQNALRRVLRLDGYEILTADSAAQALEVLSQQTVDVVLADYRMPGMNGVDLLEKVRRSHPSTVRLMLSGQADLTHVIQGMNDGAVNRFLTKPWSNEVIRSSVSQAIRTQQARGADQVSLLGLPPRSDLMVALERFLATPAPCWLVLAEIVNLSRTLAVMEPHEADALGQAIRLRLEDSVPLVSTLCFVERSIVGFLLEADNIESILPKVALELRKPFEANGTRTGLQLKYGAARVEGTAEDSIRCAEIALGSLDDDGRETCRVYSQDLTLNLHQRYTLEQDLHHALDRNEFYSEYQPQVDAHSFRIIGAEALVRWRHPTLGMISPLSFIDLAEKSGLIHSLGRWMLNTAAVQLGHLARSKVRSRISVNVSPRQFTESDLVADVRYALDHSGVEPSLLELEITESSVMQDATQAHRTLLAIREMGVRIALDDFGTGYSSLSLLTRMPLDVLKIDRSFVSHLDDDPAGVTMFRHIAELAKSLQLEVVAEGVETQSQADICADHGCQVLQGYWFHRPMSGDKLLDAMRQDSVGARH